LQNLNNKVEQSEQPKRNGRKPESSKSIRSLFERAGRTCCQVLPFLFAGLLLSNCTMKDYNFNPYTTIVNQVLKTQYTKEKTNE
tara:strand:+ start:1075 stop:1326 length:252 start_codon:yes stop_codon:yes gene_type:complete